jgi:small-conductance mechanosensitive channel
MNNLSTILFSTLITAAAIAGGLVIHLIIKRVLNRRDSQHPFSIGGLPIGLGNWVGPLRALIPAVCLGFVIPILNYPPTLMTLIRHSLKLWVIGSIAWFIIRTIAMAREMVLSRIDLTNRDDIQARSVSTQMRVFERVLVLVVLALAVAGMLMTFTAVREVGMSILASAGVAGLIVGFAAQRSIATLLAGLHIAVTQPIRLQDAVVIEDEFGWIEEITLSYVVVRLWDQRRLIVPITQFIEKPFQNWTRSSSELIGSIYLYVDYRLPVQAVREELRRILESTTLWDRRVCALQVTDAGAESVQLRALASAGDASKTWDLRCYMREKLIEFIQLRFPDSLPRSRVERYDEVQSDNNSEPAVASAM